MGTRSDSLVGRLKQGRGEVHGLVTKVVSIVLWLAVWQAASVLVGSRLLLASPLDTAVRLVQLICSPAFLATVWFSLVRIMGGFLTAYLAAVGLAIVAHRWPLVGELFAPAVHALKTVPIACVIVLLLMWVGSSAVSGPAVFLAIFPAVYFSCAEGLVNVDPKLTELFEVFGVRRPVQLLAHVWPSILPYLVGTSKNVCGMAWKAGVAAELIGSPMGSIGERIYQSKVLLETADLFAWTIVIVALSALCEHAFVALLAHSGSLTQSWSLRLARNLRVEHAGNDLVPSSIVLCDASIGYEGVVVARDVNVDKGPGSRTVLADVSGAGKTTLLRTIAGLQPLLAGDALMRPPTLTIVFQDTRLVEQMSAVQNVCLVAGGQRSEDEVRAELGELLPGEVLDTPVCELSGGQRRRVEIVRALICPSAAVVLDEPFSSLDGAAHEASAAYVVRRLDGRTLLVASHATEDAELLGADRMCLFG